MPNLGTTEIIIIALVVLVLFGSKKLPDAARSFGRSLRIFKAETKGLRDDDQPAPLPLEAPAAAAPAPGVTSSVNGSAPVADKH
ncbi:Sec-independent protein translocase subunit TatA [Frankia sp. AgB32]|uniref:Sec-independent protein translocase subunit TatA n=1 Tax=Frankia sp. AgB32 TaxID=631119 RepID=UPI00200BAB30|nr:Sec-independent protein translocase subunit TatA [Frankia sp. AgB32]MCK9898117.1 Sec-independent protein translocase subunit TatA [Frankia sp. AgB32]